MALSPEDAAYIVDQFGIDLERPLLTQVSRFDPWKDPLGVIDAYRIVRREHPDVQLALVGSMAHDDPEGLEYSTDRHHADGDPDVYILSNLNNVGSVEVNAFQVHSNVVIQKSLREGFGLTVSEALWKARPMVAGRVGGIARRSRTARPAGWSIASPRSARRLPRVLGDPGAARQRALRGQGARAPELPHAAAAARLARAPEQALRQRHGAATRSPSRPRRASGAGAA